MSQKKNKNKKKSNAKKAKPVEEAVEEVVEATAEEPAEEAAEPAEAAAEEPAAEEPKAEEPAEEEPAVEEPAAEEEPAQSIPEEEEPEQPLEKTPEGASDVSLPVAEEEEEETGPMPVVDVTADRFVSGTRGIRLLQFIIGAVVFGVAIVVHFLMDDGKFSFFPTIILLISYIILSYDIIINGLRSLTKGRLLEPDFLMTVSTVGVLVQGHFPEACGAMLLYLASDILRDYFSIKADEPFLALESVVDTQWSVELPDGQTQTLYSDDIETGDRVRVSAGELFPVDGVVVSGTSVMDASFYFGHPVSRGVRPGSKVISGCVNRDHEVTVMASRTYEDSYCAGILNYLESPEDEGLWAERFTEKYSRYVRLALAVAALLIGVLPSVITGEWDVWPYRGFSFLAIACPLAFAFTAPLAVTCGMGAGIEKGVALKGGRAIGLVSKLKTLVFNRTGTLTKGAPEVVEICPAEGYHKGQLLEYAANAMALADHRIGKAIRKAYSKDLVEEMLSDFEQSENGDVQVNLDGHKLLAGSAKLMKEEGIAYESGREMGTKVHVALDGKYVGYLVISDKIRSDSASAIESLAGLGVDHTVMMTSTARSIAVLTAQEVGVDDFGAELSLNNKKRALEALEDVQKKGTVGYVGNAAREHKLMDTVDVGVALCGFNSAWAIKSAKAIIMSERLGALKPMIQICKDVNKMVLIGVIVSILAKLAAMALVVLGFGGPWIPVLLDLVATVVGVILALRGIRAK